MVSRALQLFVMNIAFGPLLRIGLLYQKSYLNTEHMQQMPYDQSTIHIAKYGTMLNTNIAILKYIIPA